MSRWTLAAIVVSGMSVLMSSRSAWAADANIEIGQRGAKVQVSASTREKGKDAVKETVAQRNARFVRSRIGGLRLLDSLRRRQAENTERSQAQRNR